MNVLPRGRSTLVASAVVSLCLACPALAGEDGEPMVLRKFAPGFGPPADKMLGNGGFEQGLTKYWGAFDDRDDGPVWRNVQHARTVAAIDGLIRHSGTRSLRIVNDDPKATSGYGEMAQFMITAPNRQYRLSLWARADSLASQGGVSVLVGRLDSEEAPPKPVIELPPGSYPWKRFTGEFAHPGTVGELIIRSKDTGQVWIDDIAVVAIGRDEFDDAAGITQTQSGQSAIPETVPDSETPTDLEMATDPETPTVRERARDPETPPDRERTRDPAVPAEPLFKSIMAVEILEQNTDSFPEALNVCGDTVAGMPFKILRGHAVLDGSIADETDAKLLAAHGMRLGTRGVPLSRCRVLVLHTIVYGGVGRDATRHEFHAFEKLPVSLQLPAAPAGDVFRYDPAKDAAPFMIATERIRVLADRPSEILIEPGKNEGSVRVTLGKVSKLLAAGELADLFDRIREIRVTEEALASDQVLWKGKKPDNLPASLLPARNHGQIKFTTKLKVKNWGVYPVRFEKIDGPGSAEGEEGLK